MHYFLNWKPLAIIIWFVCKIFLCELKESRYYTCLMDYETQMFYISGRSRFPNFYPSYLSIRLSVTGLKASSYTISLSGTRGLRTWKTINIYLEEINNQFQSKSCIRSYIAKDPSLSFHLTSNIGKILLQSNIMLCEH